MTEDAKLAADTAATKKGRAKRKKPTKAEKVAEATAFEAPATKVDDLSSIREQIQNCKEELQAALEKSVAANYRHIVAEQVARANRRRHWNNFFHDIVIIALALVAGFFGYCLYDAQYFDFMKTDCERDNSCESSNVTNQDQTAGPLKDANWFLANYSYLFENIQLGLDADSLAAYYLYADDYKVADIEPRFALGMAYNRVDAADGDPDTADIVIAADSLRTAYQKTFGTTESFEKVDFVHNCLNFKYDKSEDVFRARRQSCDRHGREILEQIERIYEEGEVIYVTTVAGVLDNHDQNLYNFDNLFQPVALNADKANLGLYSAALNRYQYQFVKSTGGDYYFRGAVKLK